MQAITPGHEYLLNDLDPSAPGQILHFIHKEPRVLGDGLGKEFTDFVTVHSGTTNEEVLAMLIDRLNHLQAKASCRENALAITKLEEALMWLNKRTADRKARGVEGTPNK